MPKTLLTDNTIYEFLAEHPDEAFQVSSVPLNGFTVTNFLHNHPADHMHGFNWVKWIIRSSITADYALAIEYAAEKPRPCRVVWIDPAEGTSSPVHPTGEIFPNRTGGWDEGYFRWETIGIVRTYPNTDHRLIVARGEGTYPDGFVNDKFYDYPIPHIRKLRFQKVW